MAALDELVLGNRRHVSLRLFQWQSIEWPRGTHVEAHRKVKFQFYWFRNPCKKNEWKVKYTQSAIFLAEEIIQSFWVETPRHETLTYSVHVSGAGKISEKCHWIVENRLKKCPCTFQIKSGQKGKALVIIISMTSWKGGCNDFANFYSLHCIH